MFIGLHGNTVINSHSYREGSKTIDYTVAGDVTFWNGAQYLLKLQTKHNI